MRTLDQRVQGTNPDPGKLSTGLLDNQNTLFYVFSYLLHEVERKLTQLRVLTSIIHRIFYSLQRKFIGKARFWAENLSVQQRKFTVSLQAQVMHVLKLS